MKKFFAILVAFAFFAGSCFAISLSELHIVADDGTFLGTFENQYSTNSVYNQYGDYGSPYSSNSIMNKYGDYGSAYSDKSPFNKYASHAPWIEDRYGNSYGRLSINRYASGITNQSYQLALELFAWQSSF